MMSNNNKNTELCKTEVKHIFETSFIKKSLIVIDKKRVLFLSLRSQRALALHWIHFPRVSRILRLWLYSILVISMIYHHYEYITCILFEQHPLFVYIHKDKIYRC